MALRKLPREVSVGEKILQTCAVHTTFEPSIGNGRSGTPVKASMSDGICRNQGGTVEYFCIPPLSFQGMGIFYAFPQY